MDIKLLEAPASPEERAAVDALLGPPQSQWEGGERTDPREGHVGYAGAAVRARRHLLLPALQAVRADPLEGLAAAGGAAPTNALGLARNRCRQLLLQK